MLFVAWMLCVPPPQFAERAPSPQFAAYAPDPQFEQGGTSADATAAVGLPIGAEAVATTFTPPLPAPPASTFTVTLWTARWCSSCQPAHKQLDELYGEGWPVQYVDYDEHQQAALQRGIALLPCYVIERGGKEVARRTGLQAKQVIVEWMRSSGVRQHQTAGLPNALPAQGCAGGACNTTTNRRGR